MDPNLSVAADEHVSSQRAKSPIESDVGGTKSDLAPSNSRRSAADQSTGSHQDHRRRRATNFDEPLEQWERDEFEALLEGVKGHLGRPPSALSIQHTVDWCILSSRIPDAILGRGRHGQQLLVQLG